MFRALLLEETGGTVTASIREVDDSLLPHGNVTVGVEFTTVNYKDGLVINGGGGLVKRWPHVPGIDFAGTVQRSEHPDYRAGDKVILTGWRVGETHWGGCAQKASVNGDQLVPLPTGLSARQAMATLDSAIKAESRETRQQNLDLRKDENLSSIPWLNRRLLKLEIAPYLRRVLGQADLSWSAGRLRP